MKVLEREKEWMGANRHRPASRNPRPRLEAYCGELVQINEARTLSSSAQIIIPPGERLGHNVIDIEGISKGFGDRLLIDNLQLQAAAGRHRRHHRAERRRARRRCSAC